MDGVVRRNVDARIISYAIAVLEAQKPVSPELRTTFHGCAAAALQAASGIVALAIACKSASQSDVFKFDNARDKDQFRVLLEGLGATIEEAWVGELKELFEVIVVLAAEASDGADEQRFRQWAQGLFLDTRPLVVGDTSDVRANVEIDDEPATKRKRTRKPRSSKEVYETERYENLVTKAIALGIQSTRPVLTNGQILIVGAGSSGDKRLIKLRGSMDEATRLCNRANEEMRKLRVAEHFP